MKHFKHLFTALLLLCTTMATAHDFAVNGIYYNITSYTKKTVEVTYRGSSYSAYSNEYTGRVVIPDSVTYDGNTYSVTSIGSYAFSGCSGLTSVVIGNSVTSIGHSTFYNCSGLTSVVIGNSVTSIGNEAFYGCTSLKDLRIEDGEGTLSLGYNSTGKGLFYDCPLETLYLGRNLSYNTSYNYGYSPFYAKSTLTSVTIGNSVTSIGEYAFSGCEGLTNITIPNSVTSIGTYAFYNCNNVESLYIGNSIQQIGDYAFNGCNNLFDIKVANKKVITISDNVFSVDSYNNAILYVPKGRSTFYRNTTPWNKFIVIEEFYFDKIEITGISLNKTTATITEGETATLTATVIPSNATDQTITWTTSDSTVAIVDNGVVTAVKAGTATITATAGGHSASCVVTVEAASGIEEMKEQKCNAIYDLQGRKVTHPIKGIYIINGRKVFVK